MVLGNPDVTLKDGQDNVITSGPTAAELYRKPKDYSLDFPGDPRQAGCTYEEDFRNYAAGVTPTVYAHLMLDQERGQIALQYWLYFYFNDWNNKHESDWEFVQLTFDARSADQALASEPTSVVYAQHGGGETAK